MQSAPNKHNLIYTIIVLTAIAVNACSSSVQVTSVEKSRTTSLSPTPTSKPSYSIRFAWFYKPPEKSLWPDLPKRYDFFILTHRDEEDRESLRALGLQEPVYQYLLLAEIHDPGNCETSPRGNQVAYKNGDFCNISEKHPDWFLLDSLGMRIKNEENYYSMDPGNLGFQSFWIERAIELQLSYEWDGLFIDNVEASLSKYIAQLSLPRQYLDDTSLQTAVLSFLARINKSFSAQNRPVYANIISVRDPQTWHQYMEFLDGAMLENFAVNWRGSNLSPNRFEDQITMLEKSQAMGKTVILIAQGDQGDLARQQFAYASYLLVNNGNAVFRYAHHSSYRESWWYKNYALILGEPIGPARKEGTLWIRDFQYGQIIVNSKNQSTKFRLFEEPPK
jgi:hypothetical protein